MRQIKDYSDDRNKQWCIHCSKSLDDAAITRDHVPSKALLKSPLPPNLPVINICMECNNKFSLDEEYLMVFLEVVLTGSTDPKDIKDDKIKNILQKNSLLKKRIEKSKIEKIALSGQREILWKPEQERLSRVLLKNARGHAMFELGEPMLDEPSEIIIKPLAYMTPEEITEFEYGGSFSGFWPEVGSRIMTRMVEGSVDEGGWVVVQGETYRYSVIQDAEICVKSVIRDYLSTKITWQQ
jgi:hypothetical protein